jgi:hypothetical protein
MLEAMVDQAAVLAVSLRQILAAPALLVKEALGVLVLVVLAFAVVAGEVVHLPSAPQEQALLAAMAAMEQHHQSLALL